MRRYTVITVLFIQVGPDRGDWGAIRWTGHDPRSIRVIGGTAPGHRVSVPSSAGGVTISVSPISDW